MAQGPKRNSSNYSNRYTTKQRKEIALHYVKSESYTATGKHFGCSAATVKKYVNDYKDLVDGAQKQKKKSIDNFIDAMMDDASKAYDVSNLYLDELKQPNKVKESSSREAATVYGILIDKQMKLEEIRMKRLEAELRRKEIAAMEKGVSINIMPQLTAYGKRDKDD